MNSFDELKTKFEEIKKMGYIKGVSNNNNTAGETLEKLLGYTGGSFNIPDYKDVELKAIRDFDDRAFDLFSSSPDGKYFNANKWISENFGYPDKDYPNINVIKGNVYANKFNKIGLKFLFKLIIDSKEKRIYLGVYNLDYKLINKDIYWDFDTIIEKMYRKNEKLAIFTFRKIFKDNDIMIKYTNLNFYKIKEVFEFIYLIRIGKIYVVLKTGVFKKGKYKGKFTDHGSSFRINKKDLQYMFYEH